MASHCQPQTEVGPPYWGYEPFSNCVLPSQAHFVDFPELNQLDSLELCGRYVSVFQIQRRVVSKYFQSLKEGFCRCSALPCLIQCQ